MRRRFDELLEQSGFKLKPETLVGELRIPDQKKVEILQAMARNARFIVMDEPTATLPDDETRQFLEIVRQLNERGTTIVYISHFLLEVLNCADTVTVLRNGRLIRTAPSKDESTDSLITAMLGRSMSTTFPSKQFPGPNAPTVFGVRNLTRKGILENISFQIREGEIVGVAGLVGSGRSRMARTIFGAEAHDRGEIEVDGKQIVIRSPSDAVRAGIAMLPESRKTQGLSLRLSVGHNVVMPHLDLISHGPLIDERKERAQTVELLRQLDVRPAEPQMRVNNLSGGNQQKVMFAKWLFRRPRLLIADEPTRGVDVGAKRAIYHLITSLAADGIAVLFISSEIEEILGLAHRVLVMRRGMIVAQIEDDGKSLTENAVIRAAFAADSRDDHFAEDA
jgi:simple sugar transport system ATP-binding protein/ribose transport system ATP-binding protein